MASGIDDWKPHLGRKISMRYKLHGSTHPFSEAIGVVSSVSDDGGEQMVTILTRSGEAKTIPSTDVVAAKLFPI